MPGHDAQTVHAEGLRGTNDAILAQHCAAEGRAIVTLDLDSPHIRAFPPAASAGLIVLRVRDQSRPHVLKVMTAVLQKLEREPLPGRPWIATEAGVRIRGT